jgi:hypothetical protein
VAGAAAAMSSASSVAGSVAGKRLSIMLEVSSRRPGFASGSHPELCTQPRG